MGLLTDPKWPCVPTSLRIKAVYMNKKVIQNTFLCPRCHTIGFKGVATQCAFSLLCVFKTSGYCVNMLYKEQNL